MDKVERERGLLQKVVAIAGIVPVGAGLFGALFGATLTGDGSAISLSGDSHYRYLSGLLLGIGLMFWSGIPAIEQKSGRFKLLTLVVMVGGLSRLGGIFLAGVPSLVMILSVGMELVVTPVICLWQLRIARLHATASPGSVRATPPVARAAPAGEPSPDVAPAPIPAATGPTSRL